MITTEQLFQYLEKKIPKFTKTRRTRTGEMLFSCPNFSVHKYSNPTATFTPSGNISCLLCGWHGSLYDAIRIIEPDKHNKTDAEITDYLIGELNLDMYTELNAYQKYGWELLPITANSKIPIGGESWKENHYKDKIQWIKWLNNGLNIACKTGEINKITVIDVDLKVAPTEKDEEIYKLLTSLNTSVQDTPHGKHFIIQYDKDIHQSVKLGRKQNIKTSIDIRNDGGYILVTPSKCDGLSYKWKNLGVEIQSATPELKNKILELLKRDESDSIEVLEKSHTTELPKLKNNNLEGCCNDTFVSIGGMLIKQLTPEHTEFVLNVMNRHLLENPMPSNAIKAMLGSLAGYKGNDEETYEQIIYEYLKLMQTDVTPRDVIDNTKLSRAIVDKYLSKFVKDGKAVRLGRGRYQYKERIEWSDTAPEVIDEYKYKIPFFNDVAIFQDKDVLLLGAKTNDGKTTIALNMLREMIKQNVKPYYIYSEAGSRFQKTSQYLGITGQYYHTYHENPLAIELEYNAFTIIDWLHLEHKENTDTVLKHLNDELQRKGGILIIFTQLKTTSEWFAPNLIDHYPTFAARYMQDNNEKTLGHWDIQKIKEPRGNWTSFILPCEYNHETRIFNNKDLT
jgi:predicted Zn-ribbon and HTH transcriptional regulator